MTYCLGILTKRGVVMASDCRTNAGYDQVNVASKMHTFVIPGERVFVLLTSGSLSCCQSVVTLLRRDFNQGRGLASAPSYYDAVRVVGDQVRRVSDLDRPALERDKYTFNIHMILGGQIKGEPPGLFLVYPQGNPLQALPESPYLQIGETKYGRPILDRGVSFERTTLEEAAKYALLSLDSTMKSNVTVGPPIDLLAYTADDLTISLHRRFAADDPDWVKISQRWQQSLRQAVSKLPGIRFHATPKRDLPAFADEESIQVVEPGSSDSADDAGPQSAPPPRAAASAETSQAGPQQSAPRRRQPQ